MLARLALASVALLAGCAPAPGASSPSDGASRVFLSQADAGRPVTLGLGQRLEVRLSANPSTGYAWALADSAGGTLTREGPPEAAPFATEPGVVGAGGNETWTFRAVQAGSGTLRLVYRRPFDPAGTAPAETFAAPVTVR